MKEITASKFRCDFEASCPGVFRLPDGRYAVRGLEVWPSGLTGPDQRIVIIDPEMIAASIGEERNAQG